MHYGDALAARVAATSPVCVGLDPALDRLPDGVARDAAGVTLFCRGIVDAVHDIASCVKLQLAYFERLGWEGLRAFWDICDYAKERGLIVIADGKRNDIGPTCDAYADAYLHAGSAVDAMTVSPYLGSDGVLPFVQRCREHDKGIYILVKTSNESAGELQDLPAGDESVSEHVAQLVAGWGRDVIGASSGLSCVGAVVGASYPEEMRYLRSLLPQAPLLVPGYGAQGGTAQDIAPAFYAGGAGAIVNSSRAILFASAGRDWQLAARGAATAMRSALNEVIAAS